MIFHQKHENDYTGEICKTFNNYFTCVANNIGFDDTISTDYGCGIFVYHKQALSAS